MCNKMLKSWQKLCKYVGQKSLTLGVLGVDWEPPWTPALLWSAGFSVPRNGDLWGLQGAVWRQTSCISGLNDEEQQVREGYGTVAGPGQCVLHSAVAYRLWFAVSQLARTHRQFKTETNQASYDNLLHLKPQSSIHLATLMLNRSVVSNHKPWRAQSMNVFIPTKGYTRAHFESLIVIVRIIEFNTESDH